MMTFRAFLACLLAAATLTAQPAPYTARSHELARAFDLDGEAADADQVVTVIALTDAASFTIAANPDICRLVDITVTDADSSITAGVLTVTGTDCWDAPLVATFTFAAGGSGVKTLVVANGPDGVLGKASAAYFKTVTTAVTGTLTGEGGGDTVTIGYTSNSAYGWPAYGRLTTTPSGRRWVDLRGVYDVGVLVTSGATTVDITAVTAASTAPFENVSAGDILVLNVGGEIFHRKVTTRTDADNVVVDRAVTIPAAGVNFSYRKFFYSSDPQDGWQPVFGFDAVSVSVDVDANANTGGVVSSVECTHNPEDASAGVEVDTDTVATGAAGYAYTSVDLRLLPATTHCRVGIKFGTGDDADAAAEDINMSFGVRR